MRKLRKWRDVFIEDLTADHEAAIEFLQAVLVDYQTYGDSAAPPTTRLQLNFFKQY